MFNFNQKRRLFTFILIIFSVVITTISQPVVALSGLFDQQFYSDNNILYYNPEENSCLSSGNLNSKDNNDYAGNTILSASQLGAIGDNIKVYNEAGSASDIPWQLLAAVHLRASNLKMVGPLNGNGPYQIPGGGYPTGDYDDAQFLDASKKAAAAIRLAAGDLDLSDINNVKVALYKFSGVSDLYHAQAISLGFSTDEADTGDGSPYVMNRADLIRDPTAAPTITSKTWGELVPGQDKEDKPELKYPAEIPYGVYVTYTSLSKIKCNTSGLISGGMNIDQARAFMAEYLKIDQGDPNNDLPYMHNTIGCLGLRTANCVAFSLFFIHKYTTLVHASEDGGKIIGALSAANPSIETGTVPRPYAIFGTRQGRTICDDGLPCGHTGVILGVDTVNGKVIVGEAAYCNPGFTGAHEYSLASFSDGSHTYLYAGGSLKEGGGLN